MNKLGLKRFEQQQLPSAAELLIKGGVGCNEAVGIMNTHVNNTGSTIYCGMTVQCTTSNGGPGSVPGVCPSEQ